MAEHDVLPPAAAQLAAQRPTAHLMAPMSSDEMQAWWRTADAFVASGAFKGVQDVALAYVKILLGRDLGLGPAVSMMSLDLVRGNLQMRGTLLARMVRESPHYDYEQVESDDEHAVTDFYGISKRTGEWTLLSRETFSVEDAKRAHIYKADGAWMTWPRNMCFWRTISNGVKMYCPDLLGGVPVYTEADDFREAPAIGESEGDAEPGWKGVSVPDAAEVEKVIRRAGRLGHKGLAHRASIQMVLNDQPPEAVAQWIGNATLALDEIASRNTEPEPEPEVGAQGYAVPEDESGPRQDAARSLDEMAQRAHEDDVPIPGQTTLTEPEGE